ncbi:hypothetical protein AVEN_213784-1 [Araneus ventricosus]|uniref:Uncharacterized protein n=1 Tax=Araneus ventricosus TaxID=182803 RepID=A0A4Y2KA26_ARAVE|nr:hypothetical protein AVEN_213784-1 [Araneus ventricosus]
MKGVDARINALLKEFSFMSRLDDKYCLLPFEAYRPLIPKMVRPQWPSGKEPEGFQARNLIPLKIRRVLDLLHAKSYVGGQTSSRWCGAHNPRPPTHP